MEKGATLIQRAEREARKVLELFESEIRTLEANLDHLRKTAAQWASAISANRGAGRGKTYKLPKLSSKGPGKPARRVRGAPSADWDNILPRLPKTFTKEDLAKATPKLNARPKARVMALARWVRGKQIKKIGDGKYQRA